MKTTDIGFERFEQDFYADPNTAFVKPKPDTKTPYEQYEFGENWIHVNTLIDYIDWDNDIQKWTLRREPEDIPASYVEPVKYADWVFEVDWAGNGGTSCSGCRWASSKNDYVTIRYKRCPNCGAHMRNCIKF